MQKSLETNNYFARIGHVASGALKGVGNVFSPLVGCGTKSLLGRVADVGVNLLKLAGTISLLVSSILFGLKGVSFFISGHHDLHLAKYETALSQYGKKENGYVHSFLIIPQLCKEEKVGKLLKECIDLLTPQPYVNARDRYQQFVKKFDKVAIAIEKITSPTADQEVCIRAAEELALERWSGVDMSKHYEARIELATGSKLEESKTFTELPDQMRATNKAVEMSSPATKKSKLSLMWQKFRGGPLGNKYYTGTENVPNRLAILYHAGMPDPIIQMRHGSPTTGKKVGDDDTIAPNYELFLKAAAREGKSVFYTIHQKLQTTWPEDESPRTRAILALQEKYPTFYAMVQPLDGPFYKKEKNYKTQTTISDLEKGLEIEFFNNNKNPSCALPKTFKDNPQYKARFKEIIKEVHTRFFNNKETLSKEDWKDFIHIFYAYQRIDLRSRIPDVGYVVTACKDDLDRGGGQQLLEHTLLLMMEKERPVAAEGNSVASPSSPISPGTLTKLTTLRTHTSGAPINVKMLPIVKNRLDPILATLERAVFPNAASVKESGETFFGNHGPTTVTY